MTDSKSNSKETVLINRAPDGDVMCVLGVRETVGPDTPMELEPVSVGLTHHKPQAAPTFKAPEQVKWYEWLVIGILCAMMIGWDIIKVIGLFVAVIVAVGLTVVGIAYLTGYYVP